MSDHSILQLQILEKYEKENRLPSSIQFDDLRKLFPDSTSNQEPFSDPLTYATKSLGDQKLLDLQYHFMRIDGARPPWIRIDSIAGLTPLGEEFIQFRHRASEPNFTAMLWDRFSNELSSTLIQKLIDLFSTS